MPATGDPVAGPPGHATSPLEGDRGHARESPVSEMEDDVTLIVGSRRIADGRIQTVGLQPVVGTHELIFTLYLSVSPGERQLPRASVLGARVVAKPSRGNPQPLGFARPEQPFELVCYDHVTTATPTLHICLQPSQTAALETLRDAGDLTFELSLSGTARDLQGEQRVHGSLSILIPRSEWLQKLRDAGVRNTMLLEVPLPLEGGSGDCHEVDSNLRRAEEDFRNGGYRDSIASCRIAIDGLGELRDMSWYSALNRLAKDSAKGMSKSQREEAIYAVLRHYTHLAHHTTGDGGAIDFTRAEAQFVLMMTAAATAHVRRG